MINYNLLNKNMSFYKNSFKESKHFDNIVINNFLEENYANLLYEKFPKPDEKKWWSYNNPLEKKLAFNKVDELDKCFTSYFSEINSVTFTSWLSELSGIRSLKADPTLLGGGLHLIKKGGKLDVHEDFNIHKDINLLRCLNVILYLNKDWKEEWGGHLELWDKDMKELFKKITPHFNTAVIFRTDMNSNHGHPHPLNCPDNIFRISLASYYYTEIPKEINTIFRSTTYKKLPNVDDGLDDLREKRKLGRLKDEVT